MSSALESVLGLGVVPDPITRAAIRKRVRQRLSDEAIRYKDPMAKAAFLGGLANYPAAIETDKANEQHYELPSEFFEACLGPVLKYSSSIWNEGVQDLAQAEEETLDLVCQRAEIEDGQRILDLGCGWGSFSLYAAKRFPNCRITAVSNSKSQGEYILRKAWAQGLTNLKLKTEDINRLEFGQRFDRVVSVEMLEHVKNYRLVFRRVASWMEANGRFFVHVFAHRRYPYHFEVQGPSDWMAKHFFSGGTMPSDDLLTSFDDIFTTEEHWTESGTHYQKTANAWLKRMDSQKDELFPVFQSTYGKARANLWWTRWRLFYLACAELFGIENGQEYCVSHYRFAPSQVNS